LAKNVTVHYLKNAAFSAQIALISTQQQLVYQHTTLTALQINKFQSRHIILIH